jgi:rare lipoprotein A
MKTLRNFLCGFVMLTALTASAAEKYRIQDQTGNASWYGIAHQGHRMANGERFDRRKLTAASRVMPLGTRVLVSFNGRSIVVTVTDRGPYHHSDRVIDLSEAAAWRIGLRPVGVGRVTVEPIFVETQISLENFQELRYK